MSKTYKGLILAIMLLSLNLRVPLLSITPLLQFIRLEFGFENSIAGLLTTLPLVVFALASPFMATWSNKLGAGRLMIASLVIIILGETIRFFGGLPGLFVGTVIIAFGITAGNVLIPAFISGFFPTKMGIMTSSYSALVQVATTVSLALAVPFSLLWGWQTVMFSCVVLAIVALLAWLPYWKIDLEPNKVKVDKDRTTSNKALTKKLFSQVLAWDVSLFMGIQSFVFFCVSTWIPSIAQSKGISAVWGGYMGFFFQGTSLIATFILPIALASWKEHKWAAVVGCTGYAVGACMLIWGPDIPSMLAGIIVCGFSAGSTYGIALLYFGLRTQSAMATATLSGMGQAIGYVLAAIGPVLMGYLYDWAGNWYGCMALLVFSCIIFAITGYRGGRDLKLVE